MGIVLKNNAETVLSAAISSIDTTIPVSDVSSFPALGVGEYFYLTLESITGALEIVKVTQVNASSFVAVRAQEDTIAIPFSAGTRAELRITVQTLEDQFSSAATDEAEAAIAAAVGVSIQAYDPDLTAWSGITPSANGASLVSAADYAAMRALLDLEVGTDFLSPAAIAAAYQPLDSDLTLFASVTPSANGLSFVSAANYAAMRALLDLEPGVDFVALTGGTYTGAVTVNVAGTPLTLTNTTDASGNIGLLVQSDRATPAANDAVYIDFRLSDSAGNQDLFARIGAIANVVTSTSEAGNMTFGLMKAGTHTTLMILGGSGSTLAPNANDGLALGTTALMWSDLFLASGAVINFNAGDVTITHATDQLNFAGATNGFRFGNAILPATNDGAQIGSTTLQWSDLFLASGSVINWNNGDLTLTHGSNVLTGTGGQLLWNYNGAATTPVAVFTNNTDNQNNIAFIIESDRATPAANDTVGMDFRLSDSAGNQDTFVRLKGYAGSVTSTSESGALYISIISAGTLTDRYYISSSDIRPLTDNVCALGTTTLSWADLFLGNGAVINANNSNTTITHVTGGWEVAGTFKARAPVSSETSGTLTSASANKSVLASAGVTLDGNVFTAGDIVVIYAGASSRTITQGSTGTPTQRLHGSATTGNLTLAARGIAQAYFISATEWVVSGDVT